MRVRHLLLAASVLLVDCATLDKIPSGACGNGVVDDAEDCDGREVAGPNGQTFACGSPSSGATACRYTCTSPAGCPAGWGCGRDGVCRAPSGAFEPLTAGLSAGVDSMLVGDFDGDRRADVVGIGPVSSADNAGRVRVHYFRDGAALDQVVPIPARLVSPVVRHVAGRPDDLAFGFDVGNQGTLGVLTTGRSRTFGTSVFPTVTRRDEALAPVVIAVKKAEDPSRTLPSGAEVDVAFLRRNASGAALVTADVAVAPVTYSRPTSFGPEAVVGSLVGAPLFDADPTSTCDEIVLAANAPDPRVVVFSPCFAGAWASARAPVETPIPEPIEDGIVVGDVDGNGHLDVVVGTQSGSSYVLFGNGKALAPPIKDDKLVFPLAMDDLNGDGVIDFVVSSGIAVSGGPVPEGGAPAARYTNAVRVDEGAWGAAVIGTFHGGGQKTKDVVAMRPGQPDLEMFASTGGVTFTRYTVPTDGAVRAIASGDFDGDLIDDVVFAEERPDGSSDIAVAYGKSSGPLEAPRLVGTTTIVPKELLTFRPSSSSQTHNVGVHQATPPSPTTNLPTSTLSDVIGSGDRLMISPLVFLDARSKRALRERGRARAWFPISIGSANLLGADGARADLATYALGFTVDFTSGSPLPVLPFPVGLWLSSPNADNVLQPPEEKITVDDKLDAFRLGVDSTGRLAREEISLLSTTGDVDTPPNGVQEFVTIAGVTKTAIHIVRADQNKVTTIPIPTEEANPSFGRLELADVDGDGAPDLVALLGSLGTSKVVVYLNDRQGGFRVPGTPVALPPGAGAGESSPLPTGFARLTVGGAARDGTGAPRFALAITTPTSVLVASLVRGGAFDIRDLAAPGAREAASLSGGTAIVAGDLDGDGVEDLAVADGSAMRVLRQIPAHP